MLIYLNGKFVPKEEAKISVFDHGLLYGDGVFEGIRSYNGRVFKLYEHLERLYASAKYIMLEIPLTMDEMAEVVLESIRVNQLRDAYVRLVVTRGVGDLGLSPQKCPRPTIFCIADQIELYPSRFYEEGLELISVPTRRNAADALDPRVKSLNYLNNILAKIEGELCGYAEALMVDRNGYVLEGTGANIFLYRRGTLVTPPAYVGALEGITRAGRH
ncbi:MAG: hypothetical protein KatS3mg115_0339 [Candidatus Poribacteria bacterium]|nr:MAG: hypothetical protein KatS3mg115_0339 [Candidatus Poribacteria bacterium]